MTDQPQDATAVNEADDVDRAAIAGEVPGRDGGPQDRDAMQAAERLSAPSSVAEEYQEILERGANQRGEGRLP